MAKSYNGSDGSEFKTIKDFVNHLNEEHCMLVIMKTRLYGGQWQPMLKDLRKRLKGKPYVFKLSDRINEDIKRIKEMQKFEKVHNVDLAEYMEGGRERLLIRFYVKETVSEDFIVKSIVELFESLNKYHILSGGRGLIIDDWKMYVGQSQMSGAL